MSVRRNGKVAIAGDGQVSMGNTVMKGNARKVRPLAGGRVIAGFAGGTADAFTLFELFESKLEQYGNLTRAAIELAKDWRTDRRLRRLEALLCVADKDSSFIISGNGRVQMAAIASSAICSVSAAISVSSRISAKTGCAPTLSTLAAVAKNVNAGTITSG